MTELLPSKTATDRGRTRRNPRGGYDAYDLVGAPIGTRIRIDTRNPEDGKGQASYLLIKKEDEPGMSARDGWELMYKKERKDRNRKIGEGTITLLDRMRNGGTTRSPSVVLRPGLEFGMRHPEGSNVIKNLGAIASMSHMSDQPTWREKVGGFLGRITMRRES